MTDEAFGRAWAKQQGKKPVCRDDQAWCWYFENSVAMRATVETTLPRVVMEADPMRYGVRTSEHCKGFDSEAAAYAALGKAVREVHAAVPPLREVAA